ncbi:MAG: hypothetical protein Q8M15_07730 [Bacteroidota bacterium]|nr:hypothetical protein [Bacteroidota bacterium]
MKKFITKFKKVFVLIPTILLGSSLYAQTTTLYVSKQTNEKSEYSGSYSKQTDRYEQGNVTLSKTGPINYSITPSSLSIATNENKNWNGSIYPDVATCPAAGSSVAASVTGNYNITYSRPYGAGTNGTVTSTYYCSNNGSASGTGGCTFHGGNPGAHEMVNDVGSQVLSFNIVSILIDLPDTICLGHTGEKDITAVSFPSSGGSYLWSSTNSNVLITNSDQKTAHIKLLDTNVTHAVVKVKITIEGVTYEDQGVLSTCECSCAPITNGITAGPLQLNFNVNPDNETPEAGVCKYTASNAAFMMNMNGIGGFNRQVNINNGATVKFGKNCETGALTDVSVDWTGDIEIPEAKVNVPGFGPVTTFKMNVSEIHVTVAVNGNLSGTVKVKITNTVDRDLSGNKGFVMLRKGTNSTITFTFNNTNGFTGNWDWSGIAGIKIDLVKKDNGADVIIADFNGNYTAAGVLSGDLHVVLNATYKTSLFKITMKELTLGLELDITNASFALKSGSGKVQISEIKTIGGTIDLALTFPAGGGCNATVQAAGITAFTMTLSDFILNANFNKDFDMTLVQGKLKAKHTQFDVKINVDNFKIENGALKEFACSGVVKYSNFKFTLENASFASGPPGEISISAKLEMSATGTSVMIQVSAFKIKEDGSISIGTIAGNLNRAPASISFSATFGTNRFTGTFNGDFAAIGLDGAVDIGAEPAYNFAYLAITVKANVPLGQSGLKLTQIGGKVGYNYFLPNVNAMGNPQQGAYLAGLKLGVADVGNMCEVTGEVVVAFTSATVDITLVGTVAVLKNNKFFDGNANVTYKIPANTLSGSVGAVLKIPGNGWAFQSQNLNIGFFFGNNQFSANGSNMGGQMFGNKIQLSNGNFSLSGNLSNVTSVTGSLGGKATCSFNYTDSWFGGTVSGSISLNMNSNMSVSFDQTGINGTFNVTVNGNGSVTVDTWVYTGTTSASASATGDVGYTGGTLSLTGNATVTLPFSIPFYGDTITTPTISISI